MAGCVKAKCVPDGYVEQDNRLRHRKLCARLLWRAGQQAVSEQGVCLMVMENGMAGCVIARCVLGGYGEQDSRLCHSKVCA